MTNPSPPLTQLDAGLPRAASDNEATRVLSARRPLAESRDALPSLEIISPPRLPDLLDYELLVELGRGGMGVVYKARQKSADRLVALKMIRAGFSANAEERARFRSEAEAVASLQHPNIVRVFAIGEQDNCPYIALELVDSGSLAEKLSGTPLPPRQAVQLVQTLARAIHSAHERGLVHRDLKPANILLERAGGPGAPGNEVRLDDYVPKITDFGIAKRLGAAAPAGCQTRTGDILGTPSYMAPEQAAGGAQPVGPPADTYALGAILYELLTGRAPFVGPTPMDTVLLLLSEEPVPPRQLQPGLPRDVETICLRCLHKEPARRYASALDLAEDCAAFLKGERIKARPTSVFASSIKWVRRHPTAAAMAAVAALGLLSVLVCTWWYNDLLRDERDEADRQRRAALAAQHSEGQARLLAERHATEASEQRREAETRKQEAQTERDKAQRERDKAQEWFVKARSAVDLMLSHIGANGNLTDIPQLVQVRRELLDDALFFYQGFFQEKGDDPKVRLNTVRAYWRVGDIRHQLNQQGAARQAFQSAIDLQEQLVKDFPAETPRLVELGALYNNLGLVLRLLGQDTAAEKAQRRGIELLNRLGTKPVGVPRYRWTLANLHTTLGLVQIDTGRTAEAEASYRKAFALRRELVAEEPGNADYQSALSVSYVNLTIAQGRLGRYEDAEACARDAVKLLESLTKQHPSAHKYRQSLGHCLSNLAGALAARGATKEAEETARRALDVRRKLAAELPSLGLYRRDLCHNLNQLALMLKGDQAEALYREAIGLLTQLATDFPLLPDHQSELGGALHNLGQSLGNRGELRAARVLLGKALVYQQAALATMPAHRTYQTFLRNHCWVLADVLVRLGEHAEAAQTLRRMAAVFPTNTHDSYRAACQLARCLPLAQKDTKLSDEQRRRLSDEYGSQAVQLLRQGVRHGLRNAGQFGSVPVLAPLRGREDFKALIAAAP